MEEKKRPAILVTHDRNEAFRLCSKIAFVERGNFSRPVDKREFFERPATVAAARLSGCKNISRLKWLSDGAAYALDWGIKIRAADVLASRDGAGAAPDVSVNQDGAGLALDVFVNQERARPKYAGFRAHYLELCQDGAQGQDAAAENVFTCDIKRVIEDAFSYTVYFVQERPQDGAAVADENGAASIDSNEHAEPALIAWEVEKSLWKKIESSAAQNKIRARIPRDKIMLLEGGE